MMARTFASIFPRQSPSSLIFSSIKAEAGSIYRSNAHTHFRRAQRNLQPAYQPPLISTHLNDPKASEGKRSKKIRKIS
jgi:hypothetical protein